MKRITKYLLLAMALSTMCSCNTIFDKELVDDCGEGRRIDVALLITSEGKSTRTDHTQGAGTDFENYISSPQIEDLQIMFFTTDNRYITSLVLDKVMPDQEAQQSLPCSYYVRGTIDRPLTNFKVVVVSNWESNNASYPILTPYVSTIADLCSASESRYTYTPKSVQLSESWDDPSKPMYHIPLYGVKTFSGQKMREGLLTYLGQIDLLRAMAKVEICSDMNITAITMNRFSTKGCCAPAGMYDSTTWAEQINCQGITTISSPVAFTKQNESGNYLIYVPEYDNTSATAIETSMTVYLGSETETIYFRDYNNTQLPFDVVRNHHYRFTLIDNPKQVQINYKVMEWTNVTNDLEFE